jgi:hypothetical protein
LARISSQEARVLVAGMIHKSFEARDLSTEAREEVKRAIELIIELGK